jgi:cobalt/nickel transport system permease protein
VNPPALSRLDPRLRLALAGLSTLCLALAQQISSSLLGLALGLALLCLARPPLPETLRRLAAVNIFTLFLWCALPFSTPGDTTALGPFEVSRRGISLALLITCKTNAIFCLFQALTAETPPSAVACALERLGCPDKLIFLLLVSARYVHLLLEEWQTLITAAKLRGFSPRAGVHSWRTLASLLGLLLVRSHERSRRVYEAMRLRGFTGKIKTATVFRTRLADAVFAAIFLGCLAAVCLTEIGVFHV